MTLRASILSLALVRLGDAGPSDDSRKSGQIGGEWWRSRREI